MSLYKKWKDEAYTKEGAAEPKLWEDYLPKEQKIYEYILSEKVTKLEGTVLDLSEKFSVPTHYIIGFIDGISEAIPEEYELEKVKDKTKLSITIDFTTLYKKMVEYKAEHLYTLPEWDNIFDKEQQKNLMMEQKKSKTVVNDEKIGRNDPCPCGSGKKYKKCCGAA